MENRAKPSHTFAHPNPEPKNQNLYIVCTKANSWATKQTNAKLKDHVGKWENTQSVVDFDAIRVRVSGENIAPSRSRPRRCMCVCVCEHSKNEKFIYKMQ